MNLVLGRIIVDKQYIEEGYFNDKNTNIINLTSEYEENNQPTLVVGWSLVNTLFKNNVSILNKKIKSNLYWTFAPKEKMQSFNEDTDKFIIELYNDFVKNYEYEVIDPFIDNIEKLDNIMRFIDSGVCERTYITDDFIYIYNSSSKNITGIDINYFEFAKFKRDDLINKIIENSKTVLIEDYTDTGVYQTYKKHLKSEFEKKFIPLLDTQNM